MTIRETFGFVFDAWKHPVQAVLAAAFFGLLGVFFGLICVAQFHLWDKK